MAIPITAADGGGEGSGSSIHAVQTLLLGMGGTRFGPPDAEMERRIRSIQDLKQLEKLGSRLLEAVSWQDLFPSE